MTTETTDNGESGTEREVPKRDCKACGRETTVSSKTNLPVRTSQNHPDGTEAVTLLLCDDCQLGLINHFADEIDRERNTETDQ